MYVHWFFFIHLMNRSQLSVLIEHFKQVMDDSEELKEELLELEHKAEDELKPIAEMTHLKPW